MHTTLQDPLVGREVDSRYLIESRIAHGGMANVYLALDRRLDREVAFKVLYEHLSTDDEFVSRFVREARAAARLSHPNVVQVFDQGADGPVLYLAMEYLPGRTLRDVLIQRGALTPREAVSVMEPVLGALAAAHRAGIVHRDVKPENVILTDDGRIKVADFGLARAVTAPMTSANGQLMGTVAYLAPELVSRGVADARADVYAAGILLFELLTGKQPFTGDDPLQVAYRHVHESVPRPSEVSDGVPPEFDDVVLRATDRNPDARPADAGELLAELRAVASRIDDEVLDVRAAEADDLRRSAATMVSGAPAPASAPQATRALAVESPTRRAANRAGAAASGLSNLIPRLRINDDDDVDGAGAFATARNRWIALGSAFAAVLVIILVAFWYFASGPGAYQKTPDLTQQRVSEAERTLSSMGLKAKENDVFSDKVTKGQVISTDPVAGAKVRKGGPVTLNVSKGPDVVSVPSVAGKSLDEATALLAQNRLQLGKTQYRHSGEVPKDQVMKTAPVEGSTLDPNDKVTLVISLGPELVQLVDVTGANKDDATSALEAKGFKVTVNEVDPPAGQQPGTVVAMDPPGQGQQLQKGATITLSVVKSPPPVIVPNVVGQQVDQATAALASLGFQVEVIDRQWFGGPDTVTYQSVTGQAPKGSKIQLSVKRQR